MTEINERLRLMEYAAPPGWKLVPEHITPAMIEAYERIAKKPSYGTYAVHQQACWAAMLAAAPAL